MYTIRLNNGAEFQALYCSARSGLLTMSIISSGDFLSVARAFSESAQSVTFIYDNTEERFIGYTRLVLVNDLGDGEYQVSLRKEQQQ